MTSTPTEPLTPRDHLQPLIRLGRRTLRFWPVGLLAVVIGMSATALFMQLRAKHYRSESVVYYQEGLQWTANEGISTRRIGQRLKDMLLARAQLAKIVEELGLYPKLVRAGRMADAIEEMRLATTFKIGEGDVFVISYTADTPAEAQLVAARLTAALIEENSQLRSGQAEVVKAFLESEKQRNEADLAAKEGEQLRFLAKHPEFAQDQSTVGVSLRTRRKVERSAATGAGKVDDELAVLRREEERIRRQLSSPGEIPPIPPDPALVAAKNEAEAKLRASERELADRRTRFTEEHPDVRSAGVIVNAARESYRRAVAALADAERPAPVDDLKSRLAQVQQEIATYQGQYRTTVPTARRAAERTGDAAQRIVAVEAEWARLTREVAEARERLQLVESKQFVASMTASTLTSGQASQIIVIDPAFLPAQPVGMSPKRLLLMGFVLAVTLGLGLAMLLAVMDDRVYDREDVERLELAPVLLEMPDGRPGRSSPGGTGREPGEADGPKELRCALPPALLERDARAVPIGGAAVVTSSHLALRVETGHGTALELKGLDLAPSPDPTSIRVQPVQLNGQVDPRVVMVLAPDSPAAASFRVLAHRLAGRTVTRVIAVTSPRPGEGKTPCAINLALALGEGGRARVLLLEANFRYPSVARMLAFQPPLCLREQILQQRQSTHWVVAEMPSSCLHVAAVGRGDRPPRPDGPAVARCIEDLRRAGYDYVVVDTPSVLGSADVNVIEENVDGLLLAGRAGSTRARSLRKAVHQVGSKKLLGIALLGTRA